MKKEIQQAKHYYKNALGIIRTCGTCIHHNQVCRLLVFVPNEKTTCENWEWKNDKQEKV